MGTSRLEIVLIVTLNDTVPMYNVVTQKVQNLHLRCAAAKVLFNASGRRSLAREMDGHERALDVSLPSIPLSGLVVPL